MPGISFPAIEDACREKRDCEKDFFRWSTNLSKSLPSGKGITGISIVVFEGRIIEVYRLCYEQSPPKKRERVLRDFAAHFPHVIFEARWLSELVRKSHHSGFGEASFQSKLFAAIANGLRSAATATRYDRRKRALKLDAARMFRSKLSQELNCWDRTLQRSLAPQEKWIREYAAKKIRELARKYPQVKQRSQGKLLTLLEGGKLYEASLLITELTFRVRRRDLQKRQG
jgi:hypothetical protein